MPKTITEKLNRRPLRNLKLARCRLDMNQADMAAKIGMSRSGYISKENGKREFTLREIEAIMILLNQPFEDLFI